MVKLHRATLPAASVAVYWTGEEPSGYRPWFLYRKEKARGEAHPCEHAVERCTLCKK